MCSTLNILRVALKQFETDISIIAIVFANGTSKYVTSWVFYLKEKEKFRSTRALSREREPLDKALVERRSLGQVKMNLCNKTSAFCVKNTFAEYLGIKRKVQVKTEKYNFN